jgi:hypothetical protein
MFDYNVKNILNVVGKYNKTVGVFVIERDNLG